jgi:hypothetical protein
MNKKERKNINEVTVIIRGMTKNNCTNYHETADLETSTDNIYIDKEGRTLNIRRDSLYTYLPSGIFSIPRRIQGWTYRQLRTRLSSFNKRPKYEFMCQFEEGCSEPVTHRDISIDPTESSRLMWKIEESPIFHKGLSEFPEIGKPFPKTILIILIVGFVALAAIFIANSQFHFLDNLLNTGTQVISPTPRPTAIPLIPGGQ